MLFLGVVALGFATAVSYGQVVSSAMTGTVTDSNGAPVSGAAVTVVHNPTNTKFTATTGANGRFSFTGMPVGGPYTVSATASGYEIAPVTGVQTSLGEAIDVPVPAKSEVIKLEKFVASASRTDLDSNATGAGSVLDNSRINLQPNPGRSFADLAKTNPFVSLRAFPQIEALGINSRYNSIMLDGAKVNDSFGLNSSGLFSLKNPFSVDAIEQMSVSLNPVDVRQSGFAGVAINVVSKSGTNEYHGTVYDLFTDQNWQGSDVFGTTKGTRQTLKERTYGFTLGGPIWKDHLFFFVNWEKFIGDTPPTRATLTPTTAFLTAVNTDLGKFSGIPNMGSNTGLPTNRLSDNKRLIKVDWKISDDHRLAIRYSDTIGSQPNTGSLAASSFSQPASLTNQPSSFTNSITGLSSNFYTLNVKEHVWAAQLFDTWTSDLTTQFSFTNTKEDQVRGTPVLFPEIRIFNVPGTTNTGATVSNADALRLGTEISSMGNEIHVKDQTLAGSADYTWNTFTFTAGADHESINFYNLFRQGSYGVFDYWNEADFSNDKPFAFERSVVSTGTPAADISKFEQTGVFAQAKWEPSSRFNATLGIRVDYLGSPIAPPENATFKSDFGMTNAGTIDGTTQPAPRFGFNYQLDSKHLTQIRGSAGVYLGRNPWVWISNSYGNSGAGRSVISNVVANANGAQPNTAAYTGPTLTQYLAGTYSNTDSAYKFDPKNPIGYTSLPASAGTPAINLIKPGLKLPTIDRESLAIDRKLPFLDATATVEYIYTEQLDALFADNMNLKPTTVAVDGRQLFAGASSGANAIDPKFGNVIRTRDVHAGKSNYISFMIDHPSKNGWYYNIAYTRGHATEAQTLNSSTANSQWQFNAVFNQNQVEVSRSDYEIKDRLQVTVAKGFKYFGRLETTVALYYEGRSGQPYSFVYANDLNNDGFSTNDLIAVPTGATDSRFDFSGMTAAQQTAYFNFIKSSGLAKFAGSYAPRNAMIGPWQNRLDLHLAQDIGVYKGTKTEFVIDFINFGSFLSHSLFNYITEINGSTSNGGLTRSFGAATYVNGKLKPTFNNGATSILGLDANNDLSFTSASSQMVPNNSDSRWKIQAGVKVMF
jgi:hypothetical protein